MAVTFPSMLEYQEAIQNPTSCFSDPELAGGTVVLDPLGLPKPITGGFASVYQVKTKSKHFAVRCFLRPPAGVADRYSKISEFLRQHKPKWMAEFVYLEKGIKVQGHWYPVLKMEWVQGEQLNLYVGSLVGNRKAMIKLNEQFTELLRNMQNLGMAHGDLQHGNILVAGGRFRLIDYDAMFVPGMNSPSNEVGHRNFQHPKRSERDFGKHIDNFSARVIDLSLRALAEAPNLWKELDAGDEGLLFRREDFLTPANSKAFRELEKIKEVNFCQDLIYFKNSLGGAVLDVLGPLDRPNVSSHLASKLTNKLTSKLTSKLTNTLTSNVRILASSVLAERLMLLVTVVIWGSFSYLFLEHLISDELMMLGSSVTGVVAAAFLLMRFANLPLVRRRRDLRRELADVTEQLELSNLRRDGVKQIETAMTMSRVLDHESLLDKIVHRVGQTMVDKLTNHLQTYKISASGLAGVDARLAKRLARAGLKNAQCLRDIVVSRSMAEGEAHEYISIVMENGRRFSDPSLTRDIAEAVLSWRGEIAKQYVSDALSQEQVLHKDLTQRSGELEDELNQLSWVSGFRFMGLIFGLS